MNTGESLHAVDYVIVTHEASGESRVVLDRHLNGLFRRDAWLRLLTAAGFAVEVTLSADGRNIFVGVRSG